MLSSNSESYNSITFKNLILFIQKKNTVNYNCRVTYPGGYYNITYNIHAYQISLHPLYNTLYKNLTQKIYHNQPQKAHKMMELTIKSKQNWQTTKH